MKRLMSGVALSALLILLPSAEESAEAAVVPMTVDDLVQRADVCLRGQVSSAVPTWTEDGQMIFTTYTVTTSETLMGTPPQQTLVRVPGGQLDGIRIASSEAPTYALGEEVVVFLCPDPGASGTWITCGWFQGKYTLLNGMVRERLDTSYDALRGEILAAVATK